MSADAYLPPLAALLDERLNASVARNDGSNVDEYTSAIHDNQDIATCHVFVNLPFTNSLKHSWNNIGTMESVFLLGLAAQHLNTGNGSIIEEVEGLPDRCPIKFTIELTDTELLERVSVNQVISATNRITGTAGQMPLPCIFLGAARSAVSIPSSIITGLRGYPQLSPISTSTALDDKNQHPLFGRLIPADDGTSIPLVLYFRDILNVKYLGIIHINDAYGSAFGQGLQAAAQVLAPEMTVQAVEIPVEATAENIALAVSFLKKTNYAYFFGIIFPTDLQMAVMEEAYAQGIAGTKQHQWFFSDATGDEIIARTFAQDSALAKSFVGATVISASAGSSAFNPKLQLLIDALMVLKADVRNTDYISSILPTHDDPRFEPYDIYGDAFVQLQSAGLIGPFIYDSIIAAGLAACDVYERDNNVTGEAHFAHILDRTFQGTTGNVILDSITGTRKADSAFFQLINHVVDTERTTETEVQFKQVLSDIFTDGAWVDLEPFVFNDGTTTPLAEIPPVTAEQSHFSPGIRAGGLIMCGLAIGLAVWCAVWTKIHDWEKVVRASQPIFLYIICAGSIVFSSTIIPLSIDEGVASERGCDIACQFVPWLLSIGFSLVFSALFTKTYRINKIFNQASHFKRIKLTVWDVAKPMLVLLGLNLLVLTLFTALDPLYWDFAVEERDDFGRALEGYGYCSASNSLPYLIVLAVLNFGALCFAVVQAYYARNISIQYAESDYIFRATVSILMVCFIGIPVLVLARDNSDAYFFVFSAIVFLSSCCILLFIFVPKMQYLREEKRNPPEQENWRSTAFHSRSGRAPVVTGIANTQLSFAEDSALDNMSVVSGFHHDPDEHHREEDDGEGLRIITGKSQEELLMEVKTLKRKLKAALDGGRSGLRIKLTEQESIRLMDKEGNEIKAPDDEAPPDDTISSLGGLTPVAPTAAAAAAVTTTTTTAPATPAQPSPAATTDHNDLFAHLGPTEEDKEKAGNEGASAAILGNSQPAVIPSMPSTQVEQNMPSPNQQQQAQQLQPQQVQQPNQHPQMMMTPNQQQQPQMQMQQQQPQMAQQ